MPSRRSSRHRRCPRRIVALVALAPPAAAETKSRVDRTGDAPARIDMDEVDYSYGDRRVHATAAVPDLGRAGHADLTFTSLQQFRPGYVLRLVKAAGEPAQYALVLLRPLPAEPPSVRRHGRQVARRCSHGERPTECLNGHARRSVRTQLTMVAGDAIRTVLPRSKIYGATDDPAKHIDARLQTSATCLRSSRQHVPPDLPRLRLRQLLDDVHHPRHLVGGEPLAGEGDQLLLGGALAGLEET